jgi:hypothetical protein
MVLTVGGEHPGAQHVGHASINHDDMTGIGGDRRSDPNEAMASGVSLTRASFLKWQSRLRHRDALVGDITAVAVRSGRRQLAIHTDAPHRARMTFLCPRKSRRCRSKLLIIAQVFQAAVHV